MARERDELGRFVAAIDQSAEKLQSFSREVEESTRASADHARAAKDALSNAASTVGASALGVAKDSFGRAANAGDLDAGLAGLSQAAIKGVRSLPGGDLIAEAAGFGRAERVLGTAAERTLDVTGDLARYNIDVPDDLRNDLLKVAIEQENRVETERAKVSGAAFSPENLGGEVFEGLKRSGDVLQQIFELLKGLAGGGGAS